jgi:nucleoid DNA-binding protein
MERMRREGWGIQELVAEAISPMGAHKFSRKMQCFVRAPLQNQRVSWIFPTRSINPFSKRRSTSPMASTAKAATKSEILASIAEHTQLSRKQVSSVFESLSEQIKFAVGKKGPGIFAVPGLMKITVINKPATKARKGINPFTKEEVMFKAKPARKVIKVRPLKALKDFAK